MIGAEQAQLATQKRALICLQAVLQIAGWDIRFIDIDLTGDSPTFDARVERRDGLWVHARMDFLGRCTLERNRRHCWLGKPANARGRIPLAPQVRDEFLGRISAPGPRALARSLSDYIANNSDALTVEQMRNAWRPILNAGTRLIAATPGVRSDG